MKKVTKKMLAIVLAIAMIVGVMPMLAPESVSAASKNQAPAYNGSTTYYAVNGTIYKLNSKTGKASTVKKLDKVYWVSSISYYKGYLYFAANYYGGSDAEENWVCRMKANGQSFKKLTRGSSPKVYNGKIYYLKAKHVTDRSGFVYDEVLSLSVMSLDGKNNKVIQKKDKNGFFTYNITIAGGNIYYIYENGKTVSLVEYNISKKKKNVVKLSGYGYIISSDSKYVYYTDNKGVNAMKLSDKSVMSKKDNTKTYFGGKNGKIYYSDYAKRIMYEYDFKTQKSKAIKKNVNISNVVYSKSGYNIYTNYLSEKEMKACNYKYDIEAVRMKIDGKGFKTLKRYFVS